MYISYTYEMYVYIKNIHVFLSFSISFLNNEIY